MIISVHGYLYQCYSVFFQYIATHKQEIFYHFSPPKADPDFTKDIAYIYEILHSNHFISLSNVTAYEITTINRCPSTVVVSMIHPVLHPEHPFSSLVPATFQQPILMKSDSNGQQR